VLRNFNLKQASRQASKSGACIAAAKIAELCSSVLEETRFQVPYDKHYCCRAAQGSWQTVIYTAGPQKTFFNSVVIKCH